MTETAITTLDDRTIRIENILSQHRARFVLDGEQIRLDGIEWADGQPPVDAEDVLDDLWTEARRRRTPEHRA